MLKWLIRRRLSAFQRKFDYNVDYVRDILATDSRAFFRFARAAGAMSSYRRDVPRDVYCAVGLTSVLLEDCGPCTQLVVAMALQDGVAPRTLAGILRDDAAQNEAENEAELDDGVRLGMRFARAIAARAPADDLRDEIVRRWGKRALVSLAFAIANARFYPTIKYALGFGKACQGVVVAGETIIPHTQTAAPAAHAS